MCALREEFDGCTRLRCEADDVVARVEDGRRRNLDLCAGVERLVPFSGQLIEASRLERDVIDDEASFVPRDEVDRDLCLLHHLVARAGAHLFDGGGDVLGFTARGGALEAHHDEDKPEGDSDAQKE